MLVEPIPAPVEPVGLGELKAYLRFDDISEDALLAGLLRSARALCEAFTRVWLVERGAVETIAALPTTLRAGYPLQVPWSLAWLGAGARAPSGARLQGAPVTVVSMVEAIDPGGGARTLTSDTYVVSFDADRVARVATTDAVAVQLRVTYRAGVATDWNGVPEPLRQGIVRLAAHMWTNRDGTGEAGPPAVVAALWRPWRQVRLGS